MKTMSCCGTDCSQCSYAGTNCPGCTASQGRPFYSPDTPCPIYRCAVLENKRPSCASCRELPCSTWHATRDPQLTDEAFAAGIRERVEHLKQRGPETKYICTLLAVRDMARSKAFYRDLLGLEVQTDLGANVTLSCGLALQTLDSWKGLLETGPVTLTHHAGELYFETEDLDGFAEKAEAMSVRLVHPIREHSWGQRALRLYDPDGHVIEVGEPMSAVVRRFLSQGLTLEETARRMDVPLEYLTAL